jgi:hypothetical protein
MAEDVQSTYTKGGTKTNLQHRSSTSVSGRITNRQKTKISKQMSMIKEAPVGRGQKLKKQYPIPFAMEIHPTLEDQL